MVMHGLEKDRGQRYQDMADFERDLERVLAGDMDAALVADAAGGPSIPMPPGRRWPWHVAVVAVFALGIGTAAVLARGSKPASISPAWTAPPAARTPPTATVNPPMNGPESPRPAAVEASVLPSERVRRPIKGHQAVRPAVAVAPQPVPPAKKTKADDKIAPSPYNEPKAP